MDEYNLHVSVIMDKHMAAIQIGYFSLQRQILSTFINLHTHHTHKATHTCIPLTLTALDKKVSQCLIINVKTVLLTANKLLVRLS